MEYGTSNQSQPSNKRHRQVQKADFKTSRRLLDSRGKEMSSANAIHISKRDDPIQSIADGETLHNGWKETNLETIIQGLDDNDLAEGIFRIWVLRDNGKYLADLIQKEVEKVIETMNEYH